MSSTVRTIGVSAFADNPSLTEVRLNEGLERVERRGVRRRASRKSSCPRT